MTSLFMSTTVIFMTPYLSKNAQTHTHTHTHTHEHTQNNNNKNINYTDLVGVKLIKNLHFPSKK